MFEQQFKSISKIDFMERYINEVGRDQLLDVLLCVHKVHIQTRPKFILKHMDISTCYKANTIAAEAIS